MRPASDILEVLETTCRGERLGTFLAVIIISAATIAAPAESPAAARMRYHHHHHHHYGHQFGYRHSYGYHVPYGFGQGSYGPYTPNLPSPPHGVSNDFQSGGYR